jgi:O-methyltransferase domain
VWEYRASHAQEGEVFDCAMAALTDRFAAAVVEVCDLDRFVNVVDIGGGEGTFLAKILTAHPSVRATLLDQRHVIARAAASFESLGLSGRYRAAGGDFFVSVPKDGDAYLMKSPAPVAGNETTTFRPYAAFGMSAGTRLQNWRRELSGRRVGRVMCRTTVYRPCVPVRRSNFPARCDT